MNPTHIRKTLFLFCLLQCYYEMKFYKGFINPWDDEPTSLLFFLLPIPLLNCRHYLINLKAITFATI